MYYQRAGRPAILFPVTGAGYCGARAEKLHRQFYFRVLAEGRGIILLTDLTGNPLTGLTSAGGRRIRPG
jgi:hypothetical protein